TSIQKAKNDRFQVTSILEGVAREDLIWIMIPYEVQADVYANDILPRT
ncbi:ketol-acid reductoisomerase, partial [Liberibacter sp. Z1]|nr:ketol-acid reductoisomerase [Candidatus Liberibacter sp.]